METKHTGAAAITFPTTPEAFIAYQEQLAGRKLAEHEREVTAAWVEVFNHAHTKGLCRDSGALDDSLSALDELAGQQEAGSAVHRFLRTAHLWIFVAWKQGAERSISK